jgi:CHAD domain-containing protein
MLTSNFILQHWKKQQQLFLKNLEVLRRQEHQEAVHDLRVATKKLRSYLKLLSKLKKANDEEVSFEKTEQLFSVLGKHRDIEMGLSLLKTYEEKNKQSYTALRFHLEVAKQQAGERVKTALKQYDEKELPAFTGYIDEELKDGDAETLIEKIKKLIDKELKTAMRLAVHLDRQAHRIRKFLKDIFFWATLSPDDFLPAGLRKKIKKTMDYLGEWQDQEMLLRKVLHFRKDFMPSKNEDFTLLKDLEKNIEEKMESLLHLADKHIKSFEA